VLCARVAGLAVVAVFCSELSATDISSFAEILGRRWFGALKNTEMASRFWLFFAVLRRKTAIARCHYRQVRLGSSKGRHGITISNICQSNNKARWSSVCRSSCVSHHQINPPHQHVTPICYAPCDQKEFKA